MTACEELNATAAPLVAIHPADDSFAREWIAYFEYVGVPYRLVDCNTFDAIQKLQDVTAVFWDWRHYGSTAQLHARQLLAALDQAGITVFPNPATAWHYDDKIAQAYLFEALAIPSPDSYVFYREKEALDFVANATYPLVWKLRSGAGSMNVELVRTPTQAKRKVRQAFRSGFSSQPKSYALKEFARNPHFRAGARSLYRAVRPHPLTQYAPRERGYVLFQQFIPNLTHDIRLVTIGEKTFGFRRETRTNDFRASGSGRIDYEPTAISNEVVHLAFEVATKLDAQCIAFDFVQGESGYSLIECSYTFSLEATRGCPGYWTRDLEWHPGRVWAEIEVARAVLELSSKGLP